MERAALLCVLLCAALFTAGGASAVPFPPSDSAAVVPSAVQAAKPLYWKGKTIRKYVAKLTPTKSNGKVIGDAGASGVDVVKAIMFSSDHYQVSLKVQALNLKYGSSIPSIGVGTCGLTSKATHLPWINITNNKAGHRKCYSFVLDMVVGSVPKDRVIPAMDAFVKPGLFAVVSHAKSDHALCGKGKRLKWLLRVWGFGCNQHLRYVANMWIYPKSHGHSTA
ncbi:unnamed protein product [Closterium sp. NIES-53]